MLLLTGHFEGRSVNWWSLKNYRLRGRKSKPRTDFTLTAFVEARYLEPFCPARAGDGTPAGFKDAEFSTD